MPPSEVDSLVWELHLRNLRTSFKTTPTLPIAVLRSVRNAAVIITVGSTWCAIGVLLCLVACVFDRGVEMYCDWPSVLFVVVYVSVVYRRKARSLVEALIYFVYFYGFTYVGCK